MSSNVKKFEARVEVKKKGSMHFSSHVSMFIENNITKMFHVDARTHRQARAKAERYGRVISVRKVDVAKMVSNIDAMAGRLLHVSMNPYPDALSMDEMIWRKKSERSERIKNKERDKEGY